jgi:hypothetical protein
MIVISSVDHARRRILVTASGRITAKDMLAHITEEQDTGVGAAAIIVNSELAFGMMRILEMMVEDVCSIRPFRRPEEAEASLPDPSSS